MIVRCLESNPQYSKFELRDYSFSPVILDNIDPSVCGRPVRFRAHRTIESSTKKTEVLQSFPEKSGWVVPPTSHNP